MEAVGQHIISSRVGAESVFMLSEEEMGHSLLTYQTQENLSGGLSTSPSV